jgi:hypothetical protein
VNSVDLNGQQITVSGKFYQDTGNSQNIVVRISKPNALNNFSSVTTVATSANITTLSGAVKPFTETFTLGGSDATNGLMVDVYLATAVTVTSKGFGIADMQLEAGSTANPFERRDYGRELMMCQRYFSQLSYAGSLSFWLTGYAVANDYLQAQLTLPVTMRVQPTLTTNVALTLTNTIGADIQPTGQQTLFARVRAVSTGLVSAYNSSAYQISASAEL